MTINDELPSDLLLEIFLNNTNHPTGSWHTSDALFTAHRTSQVCGLWRELILGSPQVWGRLIDLNNLLKAGPLSEIWRKLVIERSGKSELWVYGTIRGVEDVAMWAAFFYPFLDAHWGRVRSFALLVDTDVGLFELGILKMIQRPAQQLQSFKLQLGPYIPNNDSSTIDRLNSQPLFSNHAPSMRVFSSNFGFRPAASWVYQLHSLSISYTGLSISNLSSLFSQMPLLESLTLYRALCRSVTDVSPQSIQNCALPHLKEFKVVDDIDSCAMIFEHIYLPNKCFLNLVLYLQFSPALNAPLALYNGISRCMAHSPANSTNALQLDITGHHVLLSNRDPSRLSNLHLEVNVTADGQYDEVGFQNPHIFHEMVSCILNSFLANGQTTAQVKTVDLSLGRNAMPSNSESALRHFLRSLSNVEKMEATLDTVEMLLKFQKNTPLLLPALRELVLFGIGYYSMDLPEDSTIAIFLKWRRDAGVPIDVLDLSFCIFRDVSMGSVGSMAGMKVKWRRQKSGRVREYVCESNNSEELLL